MQNHFFLDISILEKRLNLSIKDIYKNSIFLKNKLKQSLDERDGIIDSITYCFNNYKSAKYRLILENKKNRFY